jgi:ribosomal protein L40E
MSKPERAKGRGGPGLSVVFSTPRSPGGWQSMTDWGFVAFVVATVAVGLALLALPIVTVVQALGGRKPGTWQVAGSVIGGIFWIAEIFIILRERGPKLHLGIDPASPIFATVVPLVVLGLIVWVGVRSSSARSRAHQLAPVVTADLPPTKFCMDCGQEINRRAEICPKCGVRQLPAPNASGALGTGGPNRLIAALFAILLGGIGIHKFYLGRVGQGLLYVLFCWTIIPVIVGIVEGILYLCSTDEDFGRRYGKQRLAAS